MMLCKMDTDDALVVTPRVVGCRCRAGTVRPRVGLGCTCAACKHHCKLCSGFGSQNQVAVISVNSILTKVHRRASQLLAVGRPLPFVRITTDEILAIMRKVSNEDSSHYIHEMVDPGPPMRVFGVLVVEDWRKHGR